MTTVIPNESIKDPSHRDRGSTLHSRDDGDVTVKTMPTKTHRCKILQILKSSLKSFLLGYAISVLPKAIFSLLKIVQRPWKPRESWTTRIIKILNAFFGNSLRESRLTGYLVVLFGGYQFLRKYEPLKEVLKTSHHQSSSLHLECSPKVQKPFHRRFYKGFIVGVAALLCIPRQNRADLAWISFVRALDVAVSVHVSTLGVPRTLIKHADTILFQLACWEIMYSWFYYPEALPKPYVKWISIMAGIDTRLSVGLRWLRQGKLEYFKDHGHNGLLRELAEDLGMLAEQGDLANGLLPCKIVHNGMEGCINHTIFVWKDGFVKAFKMYLPLHIIPLVLFGLSKSRSSEITMRIRKAITSSARSSAFLATFIASIWSSICMIRNTSPHMDTTFGPTFASFICGFSLLIEHPRRRRDMALYCLPKALESFFFRVCNFDKRTQLARIGEVMMFASGISYILETFDSPDRLVMHSGLQRLLSFLLE